MLVSIPAYPNKAATSDICEMPSWATFVRLLGFAGREIDIQNYIDNTGVQSLTWSWAFCISRRNRAPKSSAWRAAALRLYCWISTRVFRMVCAGQAESAGAAEDSA